MMIVVPGRSPNNYEPDYAYDEDSSVDLEFPTKDLTRYAFDGHTPNPMIEELLDRTFSEMELIRKGPWEYESCGGAPEISCSLETDQY